MTTSDENTDLNLSDMSVEDQEKFIKKLEDPVNFIEIFIDRQLSPKQKFFIEKTKVDPANPEAACKHIVAIWSRQTGKSTVIASYIVWRLLYGKGQEVNGEFMPESIAVLAPIKEQLKNLYDKMRTIMDRNSFIRGFITKMNTERIEMKNGNRAVFMSASPGSHIRGFTATCIVIDESQDILDHKYSADILPFGSTTNALIIEAGTPKTKNHFFDSLKNPAVTVVKQPWFECPFISKEYVMSMKANSPEALWRQEYLCVTKSTYVQGAIPKMIKDIKTGDKVYNSLAKEVNVLGVLKRQINEEILKITIWNGNSIEITKNHPILSSTGFKKAEDFKEGDYIYFPKMNEDSPYIENIKISDYIKNEIFKTENNKLWSHGIYHRTDIPKERKRRREITSFIWDSVPLNQEVLRMFGLWVAEGCVCANDKQLRFCIGTHAQEDVQETQNTLKKYFNKESKLLLQNETDSETTVITNSKLLCNFFINSFGKGAKNKKIPEWIYKLSKKQIAWFLDGYYRGDGHQSDSSFSCTSSSKELVESIKMLLQKFNIYGRISPKTKEKHQKIIAGREVTVNQSWRLSLCGISYNRLAQLFELEYKTKENSKFLENEDYDLLKIKEIEKIQFSGDVYNLETDDNHTYLTEIGAIHNCEFIEEGVMVFPSSLFEPELLHGKQTGRWNLGDYKYLNRAEDLDKSVVELVTTNLKDGATYTAGLDLGKQNDNTVFTIWRTDLRPIRLVVQLTFPLETTYKEISQIIAMFYIVYQFYEFNIDYTNERSFIEMLQEQNVPVIFDPKKKRGAMPFNPQNKIEMVNNAKILFERYQLQLPLDNELMLAQFMNQQFEITENQKYKFFHPTNEHDDILWSSLLALKNVGAMTVTDLVDFVNPWEKFNEKTHPGQPSTKEVLIANQKLRREEYIPADMRRNR
jgi:intein/homing endonuclease